MYYVVLYRVYLKGLGKLQERAHIKTKKKFHVNVSPEMSVCVV